MREFNPLGRHFEARQNVRKGKKKKNEILKWAKKEEEGKTWPDFNEGDPFLEYFNRQIPF